MAAEIDLEANRKREKGLAIAFAILILAFLCVALFKSHLSTDVTQDFLRYKTAINSIATKP